ncbi:heat shock protein 75 kDa, mitochondrial isoform X2 [Macrosteles quadrilineatus]|uniref:heat shock protein 75 kDa, mitochondrial isoform X2 n=1 Tax=Macrosteles quadrilineatus TaxID=74068 RepID=UPI0023E227C5|nr:heat shock protein 75 kDa, mitochondrial isoform X2 [Macrosteles quadrilineatus]
MALPFSLVLRLNQNKFVHLCRSAYSLSSRHYAISNRTPKYITAGKTRSHFGSNTVFKSTRLLSTNPEAETIENAERNYEKHTEKAKGEGEKLEFQAETRMLLDIVAKSLYSEKEVFVRELISNASDALEKLRYLSLTDASAEDLGKTEIRIFTDKQNRTFIIQDTGVGMNKEELVSNLGTIARSGSKAFLEQLKSKGGAEQANTVIGQFGVGFYSAFMVADKVEVYTRSHQPDSPGYYWVSDGSGTYEIQEAEGVSRGTKIILHLKTESREFSDEQTVRGVIEKYSNFVGSPIILNGNQINTIQPLWVMDPKQITPEQYTEFFRFVGNSYDKPRFILHYKTDAPLSVQALLFFPESKPGLFEMSNETDMGVSLYTRRVLIKSKADNILPKWLRFVKGVVDSEDIPLNLSRELLQNSPLIRKLRTVITNRVLRFLHDKSTKEKESFDKFYKDYSIFLKEGIATSTDQLEKEEIAKLLRFESSSQPAGTVTSLPEYCSRLKTSQRDIYYLCAPSRTLAESSPYLEALRRKDVEVLFCYEGHDELVLMQLRSFDKFQLTSVEKEMRQDKEAEDLTDLGADSLSRSEIDNLVKWIETTLKSRVFGVKVNKRLESHPCVVTVEEMAAARHFLKTQAHQMEEEMRYSLLQPRLEINPRHPVIKKLSVLSTTNPELAELVTKQLFSNAMVGAGLILDPRTVLSNMNQLLTLALEKH